MSSLEGDPGDPWENPRPTLLRGALRRLAPRSFRGQIVVSTVLVMAAVMTCVTIGVQILLAYRSQRDIDRVLEDRADAVVAVLDASTGHRGFSSAVPEVRLDPGVR